MEGILVNIYISMLRKLLHASPILHQLFFEVLPVRETLLPTLPLMSGVRLEVERIICTLTSNHSPPNVDGSVQKDPYLLHAKTDHQQ